MSSFADVELWTAPDGARLALRRRPADGARRAACIFLHGFGDHAGRYAREVDWLASRGIATFALDQRGSGRTPGARGHVSRFAQYLGDLVGLRRLVAAEAPGKLILFGHSHGGLIVLRYLESAPTGIAGAIVTCPLVAVAMPVPRWKIALARVLADLLPALPIPTGLVLDDLSRDPAVVEAARHDANCHQVMSPRAYRELLLAQQALPTEAGRIAAPLFVALAGDDRIVSTRAARAFAASLAGDVTVKVYDGLYHEILKEPRAGEVLGDLAPWVDRVLERAA
ncbi:MAG: alpha/beta hydrolase [Gemmatimonadales bacterium]